MILNSVNVHVEHLAPHFYHIHHPLLSRINHSIIVPLWVIPTITDQYLHHSASSDNYRPVPPSLSKQRQLQTSTSITQQAVTITDQYLHHSASSDNYRPVPPSLSKQRQLQTSTSITQQAVTITVQYLHHSASSDNYRLVPPSLSKQ